ncbi:unnamed protein product [Tuber melanosporum]|uniref:(Perigord truffle) hypothetical protein n=1 Tax=Tuber melanosporum (strain Mel28) TaxID=656061 RepID=D5G5Z9_TUBMM|nr:uncharacterized protein GSTUM_00001699001 [Tuber melanosporum]CAZ79942.1 unnamed protein product [Tuber melanosporum]
MPVLRRYCRVSKYTVLEVRIYLDNPVHLHTWLLSPRYNVLPRIFQSIKPHVLPKLKEERERGSGGKGKSAKPVNDVVVEDDYEVSIFLTNSGTRHTVMTKRKTLRGYTSGGEVGGMTGGTGVGVQHRREEDDSDGGIIDLDSIPEAPLLETSGLSSAFAAENPSTSGRSRRKSPDPQPNTGNRDREGEGSLGDDSDSDPFEPPSKRLRKTAKRTVTIRDEDDDADPDWSENSEDEPEDKKKLPLRTEFEGFNIYSRILCLVVKRRGPINAGRAPAASTPPTARQMNPPNKKGRSGSRIMENWIAMSQVVKEGDEDD